MVELTCSRGSHQTDMRGLPAACLRGVVRAAGLRGRRGVARAPRSKRAAASLADGFAAWGLPPAAIALSASSVHGSPASARLPVSSPASRRLAGHRLRPRSVPPAPTDRGVW